MEHIRSWYREKKEKRRVFVTLPREIHRFFVSSPYPERMRAWQDIHAGKRCFLIGNGPSLRPEDLDRLQGEISFAVNRIGQIYDRTAWRPTYFCCMDPNMVRAYMDEFLQGGQRMSFLPVYAGNWEFARQYTNRDDVQLIEMTHGAPEGSLPAFSDDCSRIMYGGYSVTYCLMQLAVYMGCTELILLGMDHNFAVNMDFNRMMDQREGLSHFYRDADPIRANIGGITNAYLAARDYAEAHGIKILNATRGGRLEVFPRVTLEEVL